MSVCVKSGSTPDGLARVCEQTGRAAEALELPARARRASARKAHHQLKPRPKPADGVRDAENSECRVQDEEDRVLAALVSPAVLFFCTKL